MEVEFRCCKGKWVETGFVFDFQPPQVRELIFPTDDPSEVRKVMEGVMIQKIRVGLVVVPYT